VEPFHPHKLATAEGRAEHAAAMRKLRRENPAFAERQREAMRRYRASAG